MEGVRGSVAVFLLLHLSWTRDMARRHVLDKGFENRDDVCRGCGMFFFVVDTKRHTCQSFMGHVSTPNPCGCVVYD